MVVEDDGDEDLEAMLGLLSATRECHLDEATTREASQLYELFLMSGVDRETAVAKIAELFSPLGSPPSWRRDSTLDLEQVTPSTLGRTHSARVSTSQRQR